MEIDVIANCIFEMFTIPMSDGSRVELIPNGEFIPVTYERRYEFVIQVIAIRLLKNVEQQVEKIRKGICQGYQLIY